MQTGCVSHGNGHGDEASCDPHNWTERDSSISQDWIKNFLDDRPQEDTGHWINHLYRIIRDPMELHLAGLRNKIILLVEAYVEKGECESVE